MVLLRQGMGAQGHVEAWSRTSAAVPLKVHLLEKLTKPMRRAKREKTAAASSGTTSLSATLTKGQYLVTEATCSSIAMFGTSSVPVRLVLWVGHTMGWG